jgi:signal transduction histidine kinase
LGEIATAVCDRDGSIWIGTSGGLSRLQPENTETSEAPPILIKGLSIAGVSQHVSAIGETAIALADLSPNQNQLQIDFVGLSFLPGNVLNYQYRLEGAGDWSVPSAQRTINFANLAAGHYRFLVRAVNSEGIVSPQPAVISFVILPPVWQRWWFIMVVAAIAAIATYALYRYRISRLLELEQVRTRIASDLHDDIGAGLSRLAILSEVARHEAGATTVAERLGEIAQGSRQLVDSMSDIVWVINPKRDQLRDLVQRMRRFASDLFTASGMEFTFHAPDELDVKVGADVRRQLFLIFKEAVNNVARHSACTNANIDLAIQAGVFTFTIKDNGRGFDPARMSEGNGLDNMRERARLLKGELLIDSHPGAGTTITLKAPLKTNVEERNGRLRGFPSA